MAYAKKLRSQTPLSIGTSAGKPLWSLRDTELLKARGLSNFETIGQGTYSVVLRAELFDPKGGPNNGVTPVAVKFIDLSQLDHKYREKMFAREMEAIRKLKHGYIVPVFCTIHSKDKERVWIVMELEKSDLLQVLDHEKRVDEKKGRIWVQQLMSGLKYMHDAQWAHRDLKVENVLIGFDERALLSDFGFSRQQNVHCLSSTHLGSMQYSAPEVLDTRAKVVGPEGTAAADYDAFKADVWALGVIMFVMFIGFLPVNATTEEKVRIQEDKIHAVIDDLPPDLKPSLRLIDLIKKMLTIDPGQRISLKEAMRHAWFTADVSDVTSTSTDAKTKSGVVRRVSARSSAGSVVAVAPVTTSRLVGGRIPPVPRASAGHKNTILWILIAVLTFAVIILFVLVIILATMKSPSKETPAH